MMDCDQPADWRPQEVRMEVASFCCDNPEPASCFASLEIYNIRYAKYYRYCKYISYIVAAMFYR